jgi:hypothetical protein
MAEVSLDPSTAKPDLGWRVCAAQGGTCEFSGTREVRYGAGRMYIYTTATTLIDCNNTAFGGGDPAFGVVKQCEVPADPPGPTAPPSNFRIVR